MIFAVLILCAPHAPCSTVSVPMPDTTLEQCEAVSMRALLDRAVLDGTFYTFEGCSDDRLDRK